MAVEPLKLSEQEEKPLEDTVVKIFRCSKVVKGGRRFSFAALVVVGDRAGTVGVGYGKANEVPRAVEKAVKDAKKSLNKIALVGSTIPHRINEDSIGSGQPWYRSYSRLQCPSGTRICRCAGCAYKSLRKHFCQKCSQSHT